MNKVIFLTGATGLVGSNLIPRILRNDTSTRLVLLIRGNSDSEAEKRPEGILRRLWPEFNFRQAKKQIQVVRGKITLSRLGLTESLYTGQVMKATHIIHSAATVKFQLPLECARRVICEGTKNVMAFAKYFQEGGRR